MNIKNVVFLLSFIQYLSIFSQNIYTVNKDGSGHFKSVQEVNSSTFNFGDAVSFKSGQKFTDATLICKKGVTYTTYGGSDKAIIGDSLNTGFNQTVTINFTNVVLDNLKIYTYKNTASDGVAVYANVGGFTIQNCSIHGGYNKNYYEGKGIFLDATTTNPVVITGNDISNFKYGVYIVQPYNVEISYNTIHQMWGYPSWDNVGGTGLFFYQNVGSSAFDTDYTLRIHHNEFYDFEHSAMYTGMMSEVLVEYNEFHHNLDERMYQGGIGHGVVSKFFDVDALLYVPNGEFGSRGNVFRYNYVHDLTPHAIGGTTYKRPSLAQILAGTLPSDSSSNGTDFPYFSQGLDYGGTAGVDVQEANTISGRGYGNFWIHNNIFYRVNQLINPRGRTSYYPTTMLGGNGSSSVVGIYRNDLGSYFINNTLFDVGDCNYVTESNGLFMTEWTAQSPSTIVNNIIDYTLKTARQAGRYKSNDLYLDNNIYLQQSGTTTFQPEKGVKNATYFENSNAQKASGNGEKYLTNPNWNNQNSTIFASNIGPNGVNIPDLRIVENGNANKKGMDYNSIGDTYFGHQLGKDPTGRSFAFDIFGNFRNTNDIGAVGISDGNSINIPEPKNSTPIISSQPTNISAEIGHDVTFSIEATSNDPIGYQWWKNPFVSESESKITDSDKYTGTTSNRLTVKNINNSDSNTSYICEVFNTIDHSTLWINSNPARIQIISSNSSSDLDNIDSGLKVFLEAAYINNNKMNTLLVKSELFPQKQPYNSSPWNLDISDNINEIKADYVDWVIVELRENLTNILYQKNGIITTDGTIVNTDQTPISFINISSGNFYIVIRHRNHLSIMSAEKIPIINGQKINYDFTISSNSAYDANTLLNLGDNKYGMIAGDADANGVINNLDFGIVANNIPFRGYIQGDLDMNGILNVLDYSFINKNIFRKSNVY